FTDLRSVGSAALGLCLVAEGSVDAFIETDLYEFDWAAGALIAEEAGLIVKRPATMRGGIVAHPPHLPVD
ncbi:inositol monophosphatase family protein, partial [Microbacterium sp. CCH5-D1]